MKRRRTMSNRGSELRINYTINGERSTFRVGGLKSERNRSRVVEIVKELIEYRKTGIALTAELRRKIEELSECVRDRLLAHGLIPPSFRDEPFTVFLRRHFRERGEPGAVRAGTVRSGTVEVWNRAIAMAERCWKEPPGLRSLKPADIVEFRRFAMKQRGKRNATLSEQTVRKYCGVLKQALAAAVNGGLIERSPFPSDVPTSATRNEENERYVPMKTIRKLFDVCRTPEERLMLGLSRLAGLRIPSEIRELRWADVLTNPNGASLLRVRSSKARSASAAAIRSVPVARELRTLMEEQRRVTNSEYMLPKIRRHTNPCAILLRLRAKAGVAPWPRVTHNLRASCISDLRDHHSASDVARWMGHTEAVQNRHYMRDDGDLSSDFRAAALLNGSVFEQSDSGYLREGLRHDPPVVEIGREDDQGSR